MKLSIVIPVYNSEKFIEHTVESLMCQDLNKELYEVLLIDDGSQDNSKELIKAIESTNTNVKCFFKENEGTGPTRNFAFDKVKGKYIYFLDADDYLAHNTLERLIDCLDKNNLDILLFQSIKTEFFNVHEFAKPLDDNPIRVTDGITYIAQNSFDFEVWRYIINTKFLLDLGIRFEKDKILEDSFFTVRLFIGARRMAKIPLDVHRYLQQESSLLHKSGVKHGIRIIKDLESLAVQYNGLMVNYKNLEHPEIDNFIKQMNHKKQFLVYYCVVRSYNSKRGFEEVWRMLKRMKKINAYPFTDFTSGSDATVKKLLFVFNKKSLLFLLFNTLRPLQNLRARSLS